MKKYSICLVLALCGCGPTVVPTSQQSKFHTNPSFDCTTANLTAAEEIVCEKEYIARMDREISKLYAGTLDKYKNNPVKLNEMKTTQRIWVKNMRQMTTESEVTETYRKRYTELDSEMGDFVLAQYSWGRRPGELSQGGSSLIAHEDWIRLPEGLHYMAAQYNYIQCIDAAKERLADEQFQNPEDCSEFGTTCYNIKGNEITSTGYRDEYYAFYCIPYNFWKTLKADADEKCYHEVWDPDELGKTEEVECDEEHLNLNKDIYKSSDGFHYKIKKCPDYKSDSLFVCQE